MHDAGHTGTVRIIALSFSSYFHYKVFPLSFLIFFLLPKPSTTTLWICLREKNAQCETKQQEFELIINFVKLGFTLLGQKML
jgi:hypothetical protein